MDLKKKSIGSNRNLAEGALEDQEGYRDHLRMSEGEFDELLSKVQC